VDGTIRHLSPRSLRTVNSVWTDSSTDARLKKRIVRTVIHEVIADVDRRRPRSFWSSIGSAAATSASFSKITF
jgi:hypothetical protein